VRTTLAGLAEADVRSPAVIVIGAVAALDVAWFEARPLFGTRIQVTNELLTAPLRALGADVVETPAIQLVDLPWEPVDPARFDWVLFTSANAVDRFLPTLRDARGFGAARIAAIGPGTAAALDRWRVVADLVPPDAVAESLLDALPSAPARALLPGARDARPVLADGLRHRGWDVEVVATYATEHLAPIALDADVLTFMSSSAVDAFVDANGTIGAAPVIACIGPVTAATARDRGLTVQVEAGTHTAAGLVAAILAHFTS
jgi:uroporphyrinogen III methyltransferase/synthase